MNALLIAAIAASLTASQPHPLYLTCRISDATGAVIRSPFRLYASSYNRRFAAKGQLFLDLRYDAFAETVAVTVTQSPHTPWTFGERTLERERVFDLSETSMTAPVTSIGPDARLECG